jgi:hypothetical protein
MIEMTWTPATTKPKARYFCLLFLEMKQAIFDEFDEISHWVGFNDIARGVMGDHGYFEEIPVNSYGSSLAIEADEYARKVKVTHWCYIPTACEEIKESMANEG